MTAVDDRVAAAPASAAEDGIGRLLALEVEGLALLEHVSLDLAPGLTVLTGETGAGKSLLIDALGLVLGARADTTLVRHGAATARAEARFERASGPPLVIVREVSAAGRSATRLDGEPTTVARLAELGAGLVDVHGQHEQQRLLDHEVDEIGAARLRAGEAADIEARLAAARHGEAIARGTAELRDALAGEPVGARDGAATAAGLAERLARLDPRFEPLAQRLQGLVAELDDVAEEARGLAESVDHDPAELARLEERLSLIYGLERRYGDDEAAVVAHGERAAEEMTRLRGLDEERERRLAADGALLAEVAVTAGRLSASRAAVAGELAEAVGRTLAPLGFPAEAFSVGLGRRVAGPGEPAVELDGDAVAFDPGGVDEVVFRFAPNPGEPARPLARIASGGELSRVALAIREVLAGLDRTPTLVFDEIDSGIGGRSAEPIGRALWALARRHQVLCVTHLAQIAAYADSHLRIRKVERGGRTATTVDQLDGPERIEELAHMLAGSEAGSAARTSARELLDRAEAWRGEASAGSV